MSENSYPVDSDETASLFERNTVSPHSSDRSEYAPRDGLTRLTLCYLALFLILEMFNFVINAPLTVLFENNICDAYYLEKQFGESTFDRNCKAEPIQQELAHLKGWKGFFDTLPVFIVAFAFGKASDQLGRKRALRISLTGTLAGYLWMLTVCYAHALFPIRMVWSSAAFYLFGGGISQVNATIILMTIESAEEAYRSRIMYYQYSLYLFAELIGPAIGSLAIATYLGLAFYVGSACLLTGLAATMFIPHPYKAASESFATTLSSSERPAPRHRRAKRDTPQIDNETFWETSRALAQERNMLAALPVFVIGQFRPATLNLILQYVTVKFNWTFSSAALLTSEIAAANLFLLGPFLSFALPILQRNRSWSSQAADLWVLRTSLCLLALGAFTIGVAPGSASLVSGTRSLPIWIRSLSVSGVLILSFGLGCRASLLALATSWIDGRHRGRFFGIVQIVENIGLLVADPIAQNAFAASLSLLRGWLGIPFWVMGIFYALAAMCTSLIHVA